MNNKSNSGSFNRYAPNTNYQAKSTSAIKQMATIKASNGEALVAAAAEGQRPRIQPAATTDGGGGQRRRDKSDLGENFVAPDGGWAWMVCIAAGLSNLAIYPCLHQFGFIFRERLQALGMSSSQITTIINTNPAISACTGLLNGPMFRLFSFRQVALAGSLLVFAGLLLTVLCETFLGYMACYAALYGFGMGISVSASSLAINTYFKAKRRKATGFTWTITGLGPIFLPYLVTFLLSVYDVRGTVAIFAALSLHTFVAGLIYQPVQYHVRPHAGTLRRDSPCRDREYTIVPAPTAAIGGEGGSAADAPPACKRCQHSSLSLFSSEYLYQDDDSDMPGYEITEPGTPMMSRANDGWFGSRLSLAAAAAGKTRFRTISSTKDMEVLKQLNESAELATTLSADEMAAVDGEEPPFFKPNNFHRQRDGALKHSCSRDNLENHSPLCARNGDLGAKATAISASRAELDENANAAAAAAAVLPFEHISFWQKVVAFFDLDLLRDFTFVNLVMGLTIINFGELNFSILTPFILNDFGFDTQQVTLAMSLLASLDILVRFLVPFVTEKIPWDNRVFFLIGVVGIAIGRTVVACTRSYSVILCTFAWIGICKGIRTIFWPLIIPGYVPLKRLPAASGIQLLISGLFTLAGGPFVGLIRDSYDYSVTLHCLNCLTFLAAISWTLEAAIARCHSHKNHKKEEAIS